MDKGFEYRDIKQPGQLVNFLEMGDQQLAEFKSTIEKNNGDLEIFVHPFFYSNHSGDDSSKPQYREAKIIGDRITESVNNSGVTKPKLFLEEQGFHSNLPKHFSESGGVINYVPTMPNRAVPVNERAEKAIGLLLSQLEKAGVKTVNLGGIVLIKNWRHGQATMEGCVGEAIKILQSKFKVTVMDDLTLKDVRPEPILRYGEE